MSTRNCPHCSAPLPPTDDAFCVSCRGELTAPAEPPAPAAPVAAPDAPEAETEGPVARVAGCLVMLALPGFIIMSVGEKADDDALTALGAVMCLPFVAYYVLLAVLGLLLGAEILWRSVVGRSHRA